MMTRKEFDVALDRFIIPEDRWGHADNNDICWGKNEGQECCLEYESTRDFLWDLMTKGLIAVDELPQPPAPITIVKSQTESLPLDRCETMRREVKELKERRCSE